MLGGRPIIYGNGDQRCDFVFIQDIVDGVWSAVEHDEVIGEIVNLGSSSPISIAETLEAIAKVLRIETDPIFEESRRDEPFETHADLGKAKKLLDYSPKIILKEGLAIYGEWVNLQYSVS
jgi:UDP-glucose 4-epimerase